MALAHLVQDSRLVHLVIVDDHQMFTASLSRLLEDDPELDVLGIAASTAELTDLLGRSSPDVVVVDWQLGTDDGASAIGVVRRLRPEAHVLVLTGNLDDATLRQAVLAGSDGLVTKDRGPDELLDAIRAVGRGEVAFDAAALARVLSDGDASAERPDLSDREVEVIRLLAEGSSNKEIAAALYLSPNTVRNHIHRISGKLGVTTRLEVVVESARLGIIELPG
jgi:DNA-binding NarL/FixJ family response regulator